MKTPTSSAFKNLFYIRGVFHTGECLLPLLCFLGRLRFPLLFGLLLLVGADCTDGQSFAAILLKSSQSQPEAIADPCRPSKAAPTHLKNSKMCKSCVVLCTSGRKRSRVPPWSDVPMRKSRYQNAWLSHNHMGRLGRKKKVFRILLENPNHSPCTGSRCHRSVHNCLWCSPSRSGHAWEMFTSTMHTLLC